MRWRPIGRSTRGTTRTGADRVRRRQRRQRCVRWPALDLPAITGRSAARRRRCVAPRGGCLRDLDRDALDRRRPADRHAAADRARGPDGDAGLGTGRPMVAQHRGTPADRRPVARDVARPRDRGGGVRHHHVAGHRRGCRGRRPAGHGPVRPLDEPFADPRQLRAVAQPSRRVYPAIAGRLPSRGAPTCRHRRARGGALLRQRRHARSADRAAGRRCRLRGARLPPREHARLVGRDRSRSARAAAPRPPIAGCCSRRVGRATGTAWRSARWAASAGKGCTTGFATSTGPPNSRSRRCSRLPA